MKFSWKSSKDSLNFQLFIVSVCSRNIFFLISLKKTISVLSRAGESECHCPLPIPRIAMIVYCFCLLSYWLSKGWNSIKSSCKEHKVKGKLFNFVSCYLLFDVMWFTKRSRESQRSKWKWRVIEKEIENCLVFYNIFIVCGNLLIRLKLCWKND